MVDARRGYIDGPCGQVHYRAAGQPSDKPALLCFHMSPMSSRVYARFLPHMGKDRLAVAVDTPGFGMSDTPPSPPEIADYAKTMAAVIDALDLTGPVDLMGYHTGSMIALELARQQPDRIGKLVLVSVPIFEPAELEDMHALYARNAPSEDGEHLAKRWRGFLHHNSRKGLDIDTIAEMFPEGLLGGSLAWWGHRAAFNYDTAGALADVDKEILVINCDDDLTDYTRRAKGMIVNGAIVEKPEWGHGFLESHTSEAEALVRPFLDGE